MKRTLFFLIISLLGFAALGQDATSPIRKIELYKSNGKPILFDVDADFEIVLKDTTSDLHSTTTSISYSGNLISKDQKFLYFKPTFLDSSTSHIEKEHWSTLRTYNSLQFPEQRAVSLDRIKYLSQETSIGYVFGTIAAIGLVHTFITAPAASLRFYNGSPSFDGDFYLKQMAVSLPVTLVSFACYYSFRERTFSVRKE